MAPIAKNGDATPTNDKKQPQTFLIVLFPGFQLLDMAGPLDVLNILSLPQFKAPISMKFIGESHDPVPVKAIAPKGANYKILPAKGDQAISTDFNQFITPDITYHEYLASIANGKEQPADILFIPGGVGSRMRRVPLNGSEEDEGESNVQALLDFIPKAAPSLGTGIMTVCTGSYILARTGLLDGIRATTNMLRFRSVAETLPKPEWIWAARWVKSEKKLAGRERPLEFWTSAGVSAGMDMTLSFIAEYWGGMERARQIARIIEYDWRELGDGEVDTLYERFYRGEKP